MPGTFPPEVIRAGVMRLKELAALRVPMYDLPADSYLRDAVCDIFAFVESAPKRPGMALRDWFAGQALSAMSAKDDGDYSLGARNRGEPERDAKWIASAAYRIADAMLAAREIP